MTKDERAKVIRRIIELVWDSLYSHLEYTHSENDPEASGDRQFHKKCVAEYAEILHLLSKLY